MQADNPINPEHADQFKAFLKKMTPGFVFTGNEHCFQGRVEVMKFDKAKNTLTVHLTSRTGPKSFTEWFEDWNLGHTFYGFKNGSYLKSEFPIDWPKLQNKN